MSNAPGQVARTGTAGTRTRVLTNSFEIRFERTPMLYYHYRGMSPVVAELPSISPPYATSRQVISSGLSRFTRPQRYIEIEPKLDKSRRAFEVIDVIQRSYPQHFNPRAVFDGRENAFSRGDIPAVEVGQHQPYYRRLRTFSHLSSSLRRACQIGQTRVSSKSGLPG